MYRNEVKGFTVDTKRINPNGIWGTSLKRMVIMEIIVSKTSQNTGFVVPSGTQTDLYNISGRDKTCHKVQLMIYPVSS